jgi:hypothetical protein
MKAKFISILLLSILSPVGQALACATCYTGNNSKVSAHMAIAIWVLMGAVMSVLGGVGAFSFHIWRHAHTPLEPHQELAEEDLDQYE